MRGAKIDRPVTLLLRKNGLLLDRRSFVSLNGNEPHLFLKGDDVTLQREQIWNKANGKCRACRGPISWETFELDHKQGGLSGRCDCLHNLQALCHDCHAKKHVRPRFGERIAGNNEQETKTDGHNPSS
jgi:hypothetical protein